MAWWKSLNGKLRVILSVVAILGVGAGALAWGMEQSKLPARVEANAQAIEALSDTLRVISLKQDIAICLALMPDQATPRQAFEACIGPVPGDLD